MKQHSPSLSSAAGVVSLRSLRTQHGTKTTFSEYGVLFLATTILSLLSLSLSLAYNGTSCGLGARD